MREGPRGRLYHSWHRRAIEPVARWCVQIGGNSPGIVIPSEAKESPPQPGVLQVGHFSVIKWVTFRLTNVPPPDRAPNHQTPPTGQQASDLAPSYTKPCLLTSTLCSQRPTRLTVGLTGGADLASRHNHYGTELRKRAADSRGEAPSGANGVGCIHIYQNLITTALSQEAGKHIAVCSVPTRKCLPNSLHR
jgi:hypothetical protein